MNYKRIDTEDVAVFEAIIGAARVLSDPETLQSFGHDETEDFSFPPEVVLQPSTTKHVADIVAYCSKMNIPITPIAAQTGLSGGALSVYGGVGLSMKYMNAIEVDEQNLQATVQPGVVNYDLQKAVEHLGVFYPPDPSSWGTSTLGGNVALNAGGPRAVKYGVTKDYILNLEVVLPNGEVIWTGANTLKNSTGYNLTQLFVGSEGTLGVITKIVVKLVSKPKLNKLILVPFDNAVRACEAVAAIFRAGWVPSALEFMERDAITWTMKYVSDTGITLVDTTQAHLLIEVDGQVEDVLFQELEAIVGVVEQFDCGDILFAEDESQKEKLWKLRRRVGEAVKSNSVYKEEDTVVPRFAMPKLLSGVKDIGRKYGFTSVCYGHVGDGNLHVNIIKGGLSEHQWKQELPKAIREIFMLCKSLGGTISGEHGIGWVQKDYLDIVFSETELSVHRSVKKLFDPNGIMNPGKVFSE